MNGGGTRRKDEALRPGPPARKTRTQLTIESDGNEDTKLGRVEQRDPESQHRRDEVGEGGLPEAVEGGGWID